MKRICSFRGKMALLAGSMLVLAAPLHAVSGPSNTKAGAALDPKNPSVTLYMHPPAAQATADDGTFPELKQGPDGYWQVEFSQLAYIPAAAPMADEENPS